MPSKQATVIPIIFTKEILTMALSRNYTRIVVYNHTSVQTAEVYTIVDAVNAFKELRASMPYNSVCAIYPSADCSPTELLAAHNAKKYFKTVEVVR